MTYIKKMITAVTLAMGLMAAMQIDVSGAAIHTHATSQEIAPGVVYQQQRRITRAGLVDVHVITVELGSEYITLGPATAAYAGRGSTTSLLDQAGAVGGINADFFNMATNPSTPIGQVIQNGVPRNINQGNGNFGTFMMDVDNLPLLAYLHPRTHFLHNEQVNVPLRGLNQVQSDTTLPMAYDRSALGSNGWLLNRQPELITLVIDGGDLTHVSYPGQYIEVPINGHIVVFDPEQFQDQVAPYLEVGQPAAVDVRLGIEADIWQAVSGAGMILEAGELSTSGYVVAPNARHPRSAVGISQDGSHVFLVAVDGRNHSIGANHVEMAEIMESLGAYTAMHLDGGGSTTLGIRDVGSNHNRVANSVSDGSQRSVVNALGVFNTAPVGVLTDVAIRTYPRRVFAGETMNVYPIGLDGQLNPVNIEGMSALHFWPEVPREGRTLMPMQPGLVQAQLHYGEFSDTIMIEVMALAAIIPNHTHLSLETGEQVALTFNGADAHGHQGRLHHMQVSVHPETAGTFHGGVFTAGTTSGVIQISHGMITNHITVQVNGEQVAFSVGFIPLQNPFDIGTGHGIGQHVTMVGDISVAAFLEEDMLSEFVQIRNLALNNFRARASLGFFAGPTEVETVEGLETMSRTLGYSFRELHGGAMISLSARNGGLTATSVYNWSFVNEVRAHNSRFVVLMLDQQIERLPAWERQMFVAALEQMAADHRQVFVVSTEGTQTSERIENGVTYINLGRLFEGEDINNEFAVLRLMIDAENVWFNLERGF